MLNDATTDASAPLPRCTWCSAVLPSNSEAACPTCGATLIGEGDSNLPGVTAIDAAAIIRGRSEPRPPRRNRLMSWISGEYPEEDRPAPPGSLEPPPDDVRREMIRLEIEAQVANLQAEASAMAAEQAVEAVDAGAPPNVAAADAAATMAAVTEATEGLAEVAAGPTGEGPEDAPSAAVDSATGPESADTATEPAP